MHSIEDSPFALYEGMPKRLLPCSSTHICESNVKGLLIVETNSTQEMVDPLKLLPFAFEVSLLSSGSVASVGS